MTYRCLGLLLVLLCGGAHAAEPLKVIVLPPVTNSPLHTMDLPQQQAHTNQQLIDNLARAVDAVSRDRPQLQVVATVTREEIVADAAVAQHHALLDVLLSDVAGSRSAQHILKPEKSPYLVGPGLAALGQKHGVRHALLVRLEDPRMSKGRAAGEFFAAAVGFWASGGMTFVMVAPMPRMTASLIDLTDGRIVWAQDTYPLEGGLDLDDLHEHVDDLLCHYPIANRIGQAPRQRPRPCGRDTDYDKKTGVVSWEK